ncbi:hypothetical protein G9A89_007348 [Geosiphon pyriformis]|nr:hypothetical protein G9A89_007348 [Geosiphon pyriformis]
MHPVDLPIAVTHARDFEAAELEANHAKLHDSQKHVSTTTVVNKSILGQTTILIATHDRETLIETLITAILKHLPAYNAATNLSANNVSTANLSVTATNNLSTAATSHLLAVVSSNLSIPTSLNAAPKLSDDNVKKPEIQNYPKLEISDGYSSTNPQFIRPIIKILLNLINNQQYIPPAIITNDKFLAAIFLFELEEVTSVSLFSGAALEEKPITVMYTNAKVDGHFIKLILDTASARIITANGTMKTPIGEINDFPIEVNDIITLIKVLVMEATQYQAQLSQNSQYTRVLAMCGHFKPNNVMTSVPLINLKEEKLKPTWEAYQVSWADVDHNELPPILT